MPDNFRVPLVFLHDYTAQVLTFYRKPHWPEHVTAVSVNTVHFSGIMSVVKAALVRWSGQHNWSRKYLCTVHSRHRDRSSKYQTTTIHTDRPNKPPIMKMRINWNCKFGSQETSSTAPYSSNIDPVFYRRITVNHSVSLFPSFLFIGWDLGVPS
jgi:hypothetical protein